MDETSGDSTAALHEDDLSVQYHSAPIGSSTALQNGLEDRKALGKEKEQLPKQSVIHRMLPAEVLERCVSYHSLFKATTNHIVTP